MTNHVKAIIICLIFFTLLQPAFGQEHDLIIDEQDFEQAVGYYNEAVELFAFGESEGALKLFTQAIQLNPNNSDYFFGRASCYYDLGHYPKAANDIEQAIEMEPDQSDYHYYAGNIYFHQENYLRAIRNYTQSIEAESNPDIQLDLQNIYFNRGVSYLNEQEYDKAEADFRSVLNEDPENIEATHNLAVSLLKQQKQNACETFRKAKTLGSENSQQYLNRYCK